METAKIFGGSHNTPLSERISQILRVKLAELSIGKFSNNETSLAINSSVRGCDVYLIVPTAKSPNDSLLELLILADGLKRSSPQRLIAVMPCIGYSRQDKCEGRGPISLKLVANLIQTSGIQRIVTIDLHSSSHQGFFDIPVDNLTAQQLFVNYTKTAIKETTPLDKIIVFSVGVGNVKFVKNFSDALGAALGILHFGKLKRGGVKDESVTFGIDDVNIIGDVQGKVCILYQDLDDTCALTSIAAEKLISIGAEKVYSYSTHALFSSDAVSKLNNSKIERMVVTNSLDHTDQMLKTDKITVLDVSPLLAESIRRIYFGESLSHLWNNPSIPFEIVDYQHQKKAPANTVDQKKNQNI